MNSKQGKSAGRSSQHGKIPNNVMANMTTATAVQGSSHARGRSLNQTGPISATNAARQKQIVQQQHVGPQTTKASQQHQSSRSNQSKQFGTQQPTHQRGNHSLGYRQGHTGRNVQHMVLTTNNARKVGPSGGAGGASGNQASQKGMKNMNSSSSGLQANNNTASGKNMRSMSLSKRLAMACGVPQQSGNQTIDLSQLHGANNFQTMEQPIGIDLNNTAIHTQQFNTLMTQNELANAQGAGGKRDRKAAQSMPKTTTNKRSKHAKAFSMVQNSYRGNQMLQQAYNNQIPFSGRAPPCTEQYLNQPLQMNQKMMNQQLQQMQLNQLGLPMGALSDAQTPLDYQKMYGVDAFGQGGSAFNFAQIMSPKDPQQLMPGGAAGPQQQLQQQMLWQHQQNAGEAAAAENQRIHDQNYSFLLQQQSKQQKLPFTGGSGSITQLGSNASGALNQTGRSISHCSGRNFPKVSSGNVNKQSGKTSQSVPEGQLLESEENFESGKVFLAEQKYSEAIKMFTKSLNMNKTNFDALFYRAVSNLDSGQPAKAITDLSDLVEKCPDYRKTMFIVLSIAYRRINDYQGALRTLSKALLRYPRYIEAYIARGQIYIFQKKWEKALSDFRSVIQLQQHNGLGYLGQGDSLKGIGNYNEAMMSFSRAIEVDSKTVTQGLMKRGLLFLQMKMSEQALQDFNKLTEIAEGTNQPPTALSKAYFYKAKALKKLNNLSDAILYFEQVIRANDDNHLASSALYEISKIKIQQKDFYEAYYNLKRATHFKLRQKKLVTYKMFTEGVIFLMKRKTKTALKLICQVADRLKPTGESGGDASAGAAPQTPDYIYNLVFLYRAYGYFVTEEYENSLKDYIKANQVKKLNHSSLYNMVLCQGLKCLSNTEYENAISFFTKCSSKLPSNRDPYLLRAIAIVRYALHKPIKPKTKTKMLKDAKRDLNKALQNSSKDYNVLYLRGLVNFALHFFYDAISDLETVIEKSEEASAKHYLARGRCYACLSMFKEAITDLSIAINLNKDLLDAYLNRGKCAYLIGDTGLAFMDFQKLIVIEPKNPMVHIYAGNLLMTTGSYEDATKAFTNADNIHKSSLALYQRGRCNVALNQMTEALKDLNKVLETAMNDKVAIADRECLNALKAASGGGGQRQPPASAGSQAAENSNAVTGPITPHDKVQYGKAVVLLTKLIAQENNEHLSKIMHDSSIQHQHSQMIPSAQRTKVDKIRAIRRRKEQDRAFKEGKSKRNDLRFRVQQPQDQDEQDEFEDISDLDPDEIIKLNRQLEAGSAASQGADKSDDEADAKEAEEANYYKENIFNKEDYYLYRGVMNIYAGEYEKAISDFDQSSQIMHSNKVLYPRNQFPDDEDLQGPNADNASNASSQTDLSDVGLCSLNIHEYSYNSVICHLCQRDFKKALDILNYMFETIPKKYAAQLWIIRAQAQLAIGNQQQAKKDMKRAEKYDNETFLRFTQQKESVYLTVFPTQSRLCNQFAFVKTPLAIGTASIHLRPSFSFPFIKPPNMIPCVDNNVLDCLTPSAVPLKPEAPWIKRCSFGIKFTDEIYMTDDDRENTPDEEKEYKKRKARQQERAINGGDYMMPRSLSEKVYVRNNIFVNGNTQQSANAPSPQKAPAPAAAARESLDHDEQDAEMPNVRRHQPNGHAKGGAGVPNKAAMTTLVDTQEEARAEEIEALRKKQQKQQMAKNQMQDESDGDNYSDPEMEGISQEDDYEEDEFEQEYREKRKAYDKLEDIKQLKESIRRVTKTGPKHMAGQDAARENRISGQKAGVNRFAEDDDEEAMIEESFSVGGSDIDDENITQQNETDEEMMGIDSSGKQNLADIKKSLRQR